MELKPFHRMQILYCFVLVKRAKCFSELKKQNILIKNLDGSHPLLKNCLRVTIGTPDENKQFLRALQECIMKSGKLIF